MPDFVRNQMREIDPTNRKNVETISRLHLELLPFGPIAQLGELFLRRFCYTVLVREGLMKAALCEVDGQPAGFVAYTERSIEFHRTAIRRHLFYVVVLVVLSAIRDPRILQGLCRALRLMFSRRAEKVLLEDPLAEIVAIGVLPQYLSPHFVRRTGQKISQGLIDHAASHFKRRGLDKMRAIVDSDNRAALMFYHSLGGRFEPYTQAGKAVVQVWLDTDRAK